ncbi:hypothetical protein L218DRAFT_949361 [Marasmius fiardii PR-910]|nr:hypothetical protein L218DRAFT_949361 [Marasmius fiardii PR-910]
MFEPFLADVHRIAAISRGSGFAFASVQEDYWGPGFPMIKIHSGGMKTSYLANMLVFMGGPVIADVMLRFVTVKASTRAAAAVETYLIPLLLREEFSSKRADSDVMHDVHGNAQNPRT